MFCFSALLVLALAWSLCFWQFFFYLLSLYHTSIMASISLAMMVQSNIFNRDFVSDHKVSMELRYRGFLSQSNTFNLCFLKIAFTFRKCPSHICNEFSLNYANTFV